MDKKLPTSRAEAMLIWAEAAGRLSQIAADGGAVVTAAEEYLRTTEAQTALQTTQLMNNERGEQ